MNFNVKFVYLLYSLPRKAKGWLVFKVLQAEVRQNKLDNKLFPYKWFKKTDFLFTKRFRTHPIGCAISLSKILSIYEHRAMQVGEHHWLPY